MATVDKSRRPFYDDYDEAKGYHEILFRPGYAVQTRELNQVQSMFYSQIERFGSHVFKNGSVVIPGSINHDTLFDYVKLTINDYENVADSLSNQNLVAVSQPNSTRGDIIIFSPIEGSDPATIFVRYTSSGDNKTQNSFVAGDTISIVAKGSGEFYASATVDEVGKGSKATIGDGVYFINGRFVLVPQQTILISKYSSKPNASVGLLYNETVITEDDDVSLVDNAAGSPNFTAPGAHRIQVDAELAAEPLDQDHPDNYVELLQIEDGIIRRAARGPEYNVLGETLARRTYEESGNYTVKPFAIDATENLKIPDELIDGIKTAAEGGDESLYTVTIDSGLAYVRGFRVETNKTIEIDVDKARDTEIINNSVSVADYGYYIEIDTLYGSPIAPDLPELEFYDGAIVTNGTQPSGSIIGRGNVRCIEYVGSIARLYLFNMKNSAGERTSSFLANAVSCYSANGSATFTANVVTPFVLSTNNASMLFPLNSRYVRTLLQDGISDTSYTTVRKFSTTVNTSGEVILNAGTDETFLPVNEQYTYVINDDTGELVTILSHTLSGSPVGRAIIMNVNVPSSTQVTVVTQIAKQEVYQKSKTLTSTSHAGTPTNGELSLEVTDAYKIDSITDNDGADVTDNYGLVHNRRPNFYDVSYIVENTTGVVYPITVQFKYFVHGSGDYFSVDSYGDIDYKEIPTDEAGVSLADFLDFRPDANTAGGFIQSNDFIHINSVISTDVEHYLPRIDKVYVDMEGHFNVRKGISSNKPKNPSIPENAMTLAVIELSPYTFNANDAVVSVIDNKRYTMNDIGSLENRIQNLEYYTTLSLLEQQANNVQLFDESTGLNRFKNGFFVDEFSNHELADWTWEDYHVSIGSYKDIEALRPEYSLNAVDIELDEVNSSNIKVNEGIGTLDYIEVDYIKQHQASSSINVNPFAIYRWYGSVTLEPSVDNWIDTVYNEPKVKYRVFRNGRLQQEWEAWGLEWTAGRTSSRSSSSGGSSTKVVGSEKVSERWIGTPNSRVVKNASAPNGYVTISTGTGAVTTATTTQTSRTIRTTTRSVNTDIDVVADNLVSRETIPYIRSKDVNIKAEGLMPESEMNFWFDDVDINQDVKPIAGNFGDPVFTDANGDLEAVFRIPNSQDRKFKTGTRLLQINDSENNVVEESLAMADAQYSAHGTLETKMKEMVATRNIRVSTSSRTVTSTNTSQNTRIVNGTRVHWNDPIAQSFLVEKEGGIFLTSIDVFFEAKDEEVPIILDIRTMENGFPSQDVVPGSTTMLKASEVSTSLDGTVPTTFTFNYPIYLKPWQEYCFVVQTNSNKYFIWKSTMSERDVVTGEFIVEQPYAGVMFKSQNTSTWTEDQYSDVKFRFRRAQFQPTGTIALDSVSPEVMPMRNNPIKTYTGETYVDVLTSKGHNYIQGGNVELSGLTGGNGLTNTDVNGAFAVTDIIDPYTFRIDVGVAASDSGRIGGLDGTRSNIVQFNAIQPNIEIISVDGTSTDIRFSAATGQSFSGTETPYLTNVPMLAIENKELNYIDNPLAVLNSSEEQTMLAGEKSFTSTIYLETEQDHLSPVVDLQQCVFITPYFLIDSNNTNMADGSNAFAKYRSLAMSTENPTESLVFYLDDYVPASAQIIYSVRTGASYEEVLDADWTIANVSEPRNSIYFEEQNFEVDFTEPFTWYQVMIQLKSTSCADIPKCRNLRSIALGT